MSRSDEPLPSWDRTKKVFISNVGMRNEFLNMRDSVSDETRKSHYQDFAAFQGPSFVATLSGKYPEDPSVQGYGTLLTETNEAVTDENGSAITDG